MIYKIDGIRVRKFIFMQKIEDLQKVNYIKSSNLILKYKEDDEDDDNKS